MRALVQVLRAIARVFWLWHGFGFGHVRATACVCRSMGEIPHEVYNRIANSNPPGMESARYFVRKQLFSLLRKLEGHGDHKFPGVIARRVCIAAFRDIGTFHRQFGRGPVRFELRITDQKRLNTFCSFQVHFPSIRSIHARFFSHVAVHIHHVVSLPCRICCPWLLTAAWAWIPLENKVEGISFCGCARRPILSF